MDLGGDQKRAAESMSALLKSSLLAMLLIYALLAIPFQGFTQPLLVMAAIPFGLVGAFLGHMMLGYTLSMISFLGVIALCGVRSERQPYATDYLQQTQKGWKRLERSDYSGRNPKIPPHYSDNADHFWRVGPDDFRNLSRSPNDHSHGYLSGLWHSVRHIYHTGYHPLPDRGWS